LKRIGIIGAGDLGMQLAHDASSAPDQIVASHFDDLKERY